MAKKKKKKRTKKGKAKSTSRKPAKKKPAKKKSAKKKPTKKRASPKKKSQARKKRPSKTKRRMPPRVGDADAPLGAHGLRSAGAMSPESDPKAIEREQKAQQRLVDRERARRLRAYDEAVATASRATAPGLLGGPRGAHVPLRILAEGDSWFDFPFGGRAFEHGDVIAQLAHMLPHPILNTANHGDEVRQILGVRQRQRLQQHLEDKKRDFNVLLFSGGGNDIVGDPLCLWIRSRDEAGGDPANAIDEDAAADALGIVRAGYEQLFDMRDAILAKTPGRRIAVLLHAYDFAIPSGEGVCGFGPWLKPSLDYRGWRDSQDGKAIVRDLLTRFAVILRDLAARRDDAFFVETQGTLSSNDWHDELHPKGPGFRKIAARFVATLREAFPGEIP